MIDTKIILLNDWFLKIKSLGCFFNIQTRFESSNNLDQQSKFERFTLTIAEIQIQTLEKIQNDIRAATVPRETIFENRSKRRLPRIRGMKTVFLLLLLLLLLFQSLDRALVEVSLLPNSHLYQLLPFACIPFKPFSYLTSVQDLKDKVFTSISPPFSFSSPLSIVHQNAIFLVIVPRIILTCGVRGWTISTRSTGKLNEELIPSKYLGISDSWSKLRVNNSFPFPQPSYRT